MTGGSEGDFVIANIDEAVYGGCEASVFGVMADDRIVEVTKDIGGGDDSV